MNKSSVAFSIITYYPKWYQGKLRSIKHTDKVRGDLALEFFKKATKLGYKIVVADGKSTKTFRKALTQINGLNIIKRRSLKRSAARRQVFKIAAKLSGIKVIILTEPEKISLLDFIPRLVKPILEQKSDIVIPKRSDMLFQKTYPSYMYESENEGNKLYNDILRTNNLLKSREDLDFFFGPRIFTNERKIVKLFARKYHLKISKSAYLDSHFDYEDYSSTQYFPIVIALKKGIRIYSLEIPFSYPKKQKLNEEVGEKKLFEEKRKYQRMTVLTDLLYFLNFLKRD